MTEKKDDQLIASVGDHLQALIANDATHWATQLREAMAAQEQGGQCHWIAALVVLACDEEPLRVKGKRRKTKTIKAKLAHAIVELKDESHPPFFHAWAEFAEKVVVDLTNPHLQVMFRDSYRSKKTITEERTFSGEQVRQLIHEHEDWGPWDEVYRQPGLLGGANPANSGE